MNCRHCGHESKPGDKFCAYCGKPLAPPRKFCTACGSELHPEARFCAQCGQPQASDASGTAAAGTPSPGQAEAPGTAGPPGASGKPLTVDEIGKIYLQGEKERARDLLLEYVKGQPTDALAWTILGNCYEDLDQDAPAEEAYRTALRHNPNAANAHVGLGVLARKAGDYEQAMDHYLDALKADPRSAQAFSSTVVIALKLGDDAHAVEFGEKAWELDKTDATIAANLAVAYHYVGRLKDRDRMVECARSLGYRSLESLDKIFSGELSVRA